MPGALFEIDTKDTCLLCLNIKYPDSKNESEVHLGKLDSKTAAFRVLLRYLKVDFTKLSHFSSASSFHRLFFIRSSSSSELNLSVSLCSECLAVTNDFFELFQAFESIRIQLDLCVQQLQEFIGNGEKDEERVLQVRKLVDAGNDGDLVHAKIAEELRREVFKKCSLKLEHSVPRVVVSKCDSATDCRTSEFEKGCQKDGSINQGPSCISISLDSEDEEKVTNFKSIRMPNKVPCGVAKLTKLVKAQKNRKLSQKLTKIEDGNKVLKRLGSSPGQFRRKRRLCGSQSAYSFISAYMRQRITSARSGPQESTPPVTPVEGPRQPKLVRVEKEIITRKRRVQVRTSNNDDEDWFKKFANFEKSSDETRSAWECILCGKEFISQNTFRNHLMNLHPINYYSGRIPPSVTHQKLQKAVFYFLGKSKKVAVPKDGRRLRQCIFCHCKIEYGYKLKTHLLRHHLDEIIEDIGSIDIDKLTLHPPVRHKRVDRDADLEKDGGKWKCPECENKFTTKGSLQRHQMVVHTMDYFSNLIPPSVSKLQLEATLTHLNQKAHEESLPSKNGGATNIWKKCPFCEYRLNSSSFRQTLRFHFVQYHFSHVIAHAKEQTADGNEVQGRENTIIGCEYCRRLFASNFHLRRHLISNHSYNFFKHRLPDGVSEQGLEKGLESMTKKLEGSHKFNFKCSSCGKGCRHRWNLKMHLLLTHFKQVSRNAVKNSTPTRALEAAQIESAPVVAFVVDPGFKTESPLEAEQLLADDGKIDVCDEITITEPVMAKVDPDMVEEKGTGELQKKKGSKKVLKNECAICGKIFSSRKSRLNHRRVHLRIASNAEGPRKCELCGKVVSCGHYLYRHKLQVHPTELLKDSLPPGVTKGQLNAAMESILENMKQLPSELGGKFECPLCKRKLCGKSQIKIHLMQSHVENVVQKVDHSRLKQNRYVGNNRRPHTAPSLKRVPGSQKCEHCEKYIIREGGKLRKHLMLDHPFILFKDRLSPGICEQEFEEAVERMHAKFKVFPKGPNDPRPFTECYLCLKKLRKHLPSLRFHVLRNHLEEVVKKADEIHEGGNKLLIAREKTLIDCHYFRSVDK